MRDYGVLFWAGYVGLAMVTIWVHEVAHIWAAVRLGVPVDRLRIGVGPRMVRVRLRGIPVEIRAFPIAAAARCGWDGEDPWKAALVAVAGPMSSLILGAVFLAAAVATAFWALPVHTWPHALAVAAQAVLCGTPPAHPIAPATPLQVRSALMLLAGAATSAGAGLANLAPLPMLDGFLLLVALASVRRGRLPRLSPRLGLVGYSLMLAGSLAVLWRIGG